MPLPLHEFPAWTHSLASMIADWCPEHRQVMTRCLGCGAHRMLDQDALAALAEKVGPEYCLVSRRSRCRIRDCRGWWVFYYQSGVLRPLWDDAAVARWVAREVALWGCGDRRGGRGRAG